MLGAIIGDIVGSRFEFNNHKSKNFELFTVDCRVTDDSIMTLAVAKAVMEASKIKGPSFGDEEYDPDYYSLIESMTVKYMQEIGRKYPHCGYGGMFSHWVFSENPEPYNSFGNGAAMRVSPAGIAARTASEASWLSEAITGVTHNHSEGLKGAEAVAVAIHMARRGYSKNEIREKITLNYYSLDFTIDEIRAAYEFNETCQETVPQAIEAFLEANSFEDAIRTAVSVGGDSDTLAAITGSIAEAFYGVPQALKEKALTYLDADLRTIYDEWVAFIGYEGSTSRFKVLTKHIGKIAKADVYGEWRPVREKDSIPKHVIHLQGLAYNDVVDSFTADFHSFAMSHPEYQLTSYRSILESYGIQWDMESMRNVDVAALDEHGLLALLMGAIRADRFCEGALLGFFENGCILRWLKRLKSIDDSNLKSTVAEIYFRIGGFFGGHDTYHFRFKDHTAEWVMTLGLAEPIVKHLSSEETRAILTDFEALQVEYWDSEYIDFYISDGTQWELGVRYEGQRGKVWVGSNAYPDNWQELHQFFDIK